MRLRWPFVRRSIHAAALDAQLRRHHTHQGNLHDKLNRESRDRIAIEAELAAARIEIEEDNEGISLQSDEIRDCHHELTRLEARLASFGHVTPHDWAAPLPCWASTVAVADINGVRGTIAGMPADPTSDDPRVNLSLPMGLEPL